MLCHVWIANQTLHLINAGLARLCFSGVRKEEVLDLGKILSKKIPDRS